MVDLKDNITPKFGEVPCSTGDDKQHLLRWTEWGNPTNTRILICAHGLSRNSRDFDYLAQALVDRYRVICPDYPGRGRSEWLANSAFYTNAQYLQDTLQLIEVLEYEQLDWVGTSMGGLIGIELASLPGNPITRMVVNDVGACIPGEALTQISEYLRVHPVFTTLHQAEVYFRTVYAGFGPLADEHYRHFVENGTRPTDSGEGYILNYDPAIIDQFTSTVFSDIELWHLWDRVTIPMLIIRGQNSGLLLAETVEQMKHRHPGAESVEFANCAHAPSLMEQDQIDVICRWLDT
jgi:pimeloyl-ACP methyl ester carboxylesterase